jgi:CBS domain containing-hemolysin-like protein/mannitol/fructose-specific phosphotransferase system IIA component
MNEFVALFAALFFLLLNAFFVLAEFAIVKVRFTRLEELSAKGNLTARTAKEIVSQLEAYLSTAQLGITIASLGLGWVGEPAIAHVVTPLLGWLHIPVSSALTHSISLAVGFTIITGLHVVVGELVPKNMAIRMPETAALAVAYPFKFFHTVMFVPMWILNETANYILRLLRVKARESESVHSDEELRMILGQSQEHGRISLGRLMMFENLFDFGKTLVKEVMTPRSAICYLAMERPWKENLALVKEKKFSRYPLARTSLDDIDGFVHFKDIAMAELRCDLSQAPSELTAFRRDLNYIPEEMNVERALREFQEKRMHMALVKNSKGELTGLLTMEDIVEELTGEIRDEFEQPPKLFLSNILYREACVMDLREGERFEAIKAVLDAAHKAQPVFNKDEALKAVIKREKNFSTALGHQVAFPHARLESLAKPLLAVGRSKQGIFFPAPDNQPVRVLFLILTPFNEPTLQLNILSQLSYLISNLTLRKRLLGASTSDQLFDIIKAFENKVLK